MKDLKYIIIGIAIITSAIILSAAYTYKYRVQETILVTGLGEMEFTSDLIVWDGTIVAEAKDAETGYAMIEQSKKKVYDFIISKGITADIIVFDFVNAHKRFETIYKTNGEWAGQRFAGYELRQRVSIESKEVEKVEVISREISSLIAKGVQIEAFTPSYYYTKLDDVKLTLIEKASSDARLRAEKIAKFTGSDIDGVRSAKMGIFQITGANSNETFTSGGNFNTSSRNKKARITMRVEYQID